MGVSVYSYPTTSPNDVAGLKKILKNIPISEIGRIALLGKTEGPATINDYSRELALEAAERAIMQYGGEQLLSRTTSIFSTGCEGILSPLVYVLISTPNEKVQKNGPPQLVMGGAQTRKLNPKELITNIQVEEVAAAVDMAKKEAGLKSDETSLVFVKSPILTPNDAALTGDPQVMARAGISGLSRGAAALGVALALDEIDQQILEQPIIGQDFSHYATRAMTFSGTEVKHCEVLVLGNRPGIKGTSRIYSKQLTDILDIASLKDLFCQAGCSLNIKGELQDNSIIQAVMLKAGVAPDGYLRGERTTVYQSELDADKHMRAAASGVVGSLLGTGRIFVSGGSEHQAIPGGGICACIVNTK
tara:strand:- start:841 stop:1920 length:1080 start_codon:yes stop_codon:yes gene_type:complete